MNFTITKTTAPKEKPDWQNLSFGKIFTDHMFLMDCNPEKGWHNGRVVPYGNLSLDPAAMVLHYGQELFEGLKAYRSDNDAANRKDTADRQVQFFRPLENIRRFNRSCSRLSIPEIDEELFLSAMRELIKTDIDWVPEDPSSSLYIRPYLIATDAHLGVRRSFNYLFVIILSPVSAYYKDGITPTKILIESQDVRSVPGGLGSVKAGANYAATIRAQTRAEEQGFTQVMWLDGTTRKYIEEIGTSNAFFVIDGKVVTPALSGSILPGITRDSVLQLLKKWGIPAEERQISLQEIWQAHDEGKLEEVFATGTAAVISPVGELFYQDKSITIANKQVGKLAQKLYTSLIDIQWGRAEDEMNWVLPL